MSLRKRTTAEVEAAEQRQKTLPCLPHPTLEGEEGEEVAEQPVTAPLRRTPAGVEAAGEGVGAELPHHHLRHVVVAGEAAGEVVEGH